MTQSRLIGIVAFVAWLLVGAPAFIRHAGAPPVDVRWVVAFAVLTISLAASVRRPYFVLLLAQSASALALVVLRCNGYEGILLAVVAMQLGTRLNRRVGIAWVVLQTAVLTAATATQFNLRAAFLLAPPYLGFQLVAFFTFEFMAREVAARASLADSNRELRAMQQILAETSRLSERLRVAHELHDALGHHLTTLTLNLEAALQLTQGAARASVEMAQSLARELLGDVRGIVAGSVAADGVNLERALEALVSTVPRPRVHLQVADDLRIADPEKAHTLLRCVQEILTNAIRHSAAQNLWIVVQHEESAIRIVAHDDGRGSEVRDGFGLRGMRERLERGGGALRITSQPGQGFGVTAVLPVRQGQGAQ
ncbi:MAG TPA: sensor histidine kinase [Myxococcales bacterium]|nr:sensor histidine kinase [Myxococcales bacterium]